MKYNWNTKLIAKNCTIKLELRNLKESRQLLTSEKAQLQVKIKGNRIAPMPDQSL